MSVQTTSAIRLNAMDVVKSGHAQNVLDPIDTCIKPRPLVIRPMKTHLNIRCKQGHKFIKVSGLKRVKSYGQIYAAILSFLGLSYTYY